MHKHKRYFGYVIRELDILMGRTIDSEAKKLGLKDIRGPQAKVLRFVFYNSERKIYQKDIEQELALRKASITKMLNGMEENGYIERVVSPRDKRLKQIVLTDKANRTMKNIETMLFDIEAQLTRDISQEEHEQFLQITEKIKHNLQNS
ncbi:MAG: MarR family winged helix-turn-helix transcriptional regulator [Enterococcus sp.]